MANAAVTSIDEAFLASAAPQERDRVARAEFSRLIRVRKGEEGIGHKTEIDQNLDLTLDNYLSKLTRQELIEIHKKTRA